jgi:hypothetical protein
MVDGSVQRVRGVAHVVAQPSRVENGIGFGKIRIAMLGNRMPVFAKGHHQPLEDLDCNVGLQPHSLRQQIVGMSGRLLAPGLQRAIKTVTVGRKFHALDHLQIDEVVRLLRSLQGQLRSLPPAIRLRTEVGQLSFGLAQEGWNVRRQLLGRDAVDRAVTFIAPRPCRRDKNSNRQQAHRGSTDSGFHFTNRFASCQGTTFSRADGAVCYGISWVLATPAPNAAQTTSCGRTRSAPA